MIKYLFSMLKQNILHTMDGLKSIFVNWKLWCKKVVFKFVCYQLNVLNDHYKLVEISGLFWNYIQP